MVREPDRFVAAFSLTLSVVARFAAVAAAACQSSLPLAAAVACGWLAGRLAPPGGDVTGKAHRRK